MSESLREKAHTSVDRIFNAPTIKHKRLAPVQVALSDEDVREMDGHCNSRPFAISRSQFGCVAVRAILDSLRNGSHTMESLFGKYLRAPLPPISEGE